MHTPVLLKEAIDALNIHPNGRYIDATLGEGGHLREIVAKGGEVLGIDWDDNQIKKLESLTSNPKIKLSQGNYAEVQRIAEEQNVVPVDGILFDLGLSMEQLNSSQKGFSYKRLDEPLDMRIGGNIQETASDLLNSLNEDALYDIFAKYSEELDSRIIAHTIVSVRLKRSMDKVGDLKNVVQLAMGECHQKHPHSLNRTLTRLFQALRVAVNNEFENIREGLSGALKITKPGGKIVIITFHSLEDRVVKQFIKTNNLKSDQIIRGNQEISFERSATLRVITV